MTHDERMKLLIENGGAILAFQAPGTPLDWAREVANGFVRFDDANDLFVHRDAVSVDDGGYVMPDHAGAAFAQDLRDVGFAITETGGGCTAWRKNFADGSYVMITGANDGTSHETPRGAAMIGLYTGADENVFIATKAGA